MIDHIDVALECEYIDLKFSQEMIDEVKTSIRILNGYIKYLRERKESD